MGSEMCIRDRLLSGIDPVMAFGNDTYLHDVLTRFGGTNAITARGWVQLSLEDLVRLDPEAVVLVMDRVPAEAPPATVALSALGGLDIEATRAGRLDLLAHPDAMLPSSGVTGVARAMREVLHRLAEDHAS